MFLKIHRSRLFKAFSERTVRKKKENKIFLNDMEELAEEEKALAVLSEKEVLANEHRLQLPHDEQKTDQKEITEQTAMTSATSTEEDGVTSEQSTVANNSKTPRVSYVNFDASPTAISGEPTNSTTSMQRMLSPEGRVSSSSILKTASVVTPLRPSDCGTTPLRQTGEDSDAEIAELKQKVTELQAALAVRLLRHISPNRTPQRGGGGGPQTLSSTSPLGRTPQTQRKPRTLMPLHATTDSSSSPLKDLTFSPTQTTENNHHLHASPHNGTSSGSSSRQQQQLCNPRRLRDGLAAMSTEVRQEDFATIIAKRELRLVTAMDERKALQKKCNALLQDVAPLEAQRDDLASLRQHYHTQVRHVQAQEKEIQQEILKLHWEETKLHEQVTLVTRTMQSFRHQRSEAEMKALSEFNQVSFELTKLRNALAEEDKHYEDTWKQLRGELRLLQESIVTFSPQEYLAATVAAGLQKKQLARELGDERQAAKFLSSALGAADRRKTVMKMEKQREGLDTFLKGS